MLKLITKSFIKSVSKRGLHHDRTQTWMSHFDFFRRDGGCDMVKKTEHIEPWMSEAFLIWVQYIGYRIVTKGLHSEFVPTYVSKQLPRGGSIDHRGRLNKAASNLFKEFKDHLRA